MIDFYFCVTPFNLKVIKKKGYYINILELENPWSVKYVLQYYDII